MLSDLFEKIIASLSQGICVLDRGGECIYASSKAATMLGFPSTDSMLGQPLWARLHEGAPDPGNGQASSGELFKSLEAGLEVAGEKNWTVDGRRICLQYSVQPIHQDGLIAAATFSFADVTRRRRYEEQLIRVLSRNRALLCLVPDTLFWISREGTLLDVHLPQGKNSLGPVESLLGKRLEEVLPSPYGERCRERISEAFRTGVAQRFQERVPRGGVSCTLDVQVISTDRNEALLLERDVTDTVERGETERLLHAASSRFRGVFDHSFIGILFLERSGDCLDANDAALKLIGYTREDLPARVISWTALTPAEKRSLESLENLSIRPGACLPFEKEMVRKDGSHAHVMVGMTELQAGSDAIVVFLLDLTEAKRKEQLVAEQRSKMIAASRLSALGEMAGGIAHEINNPLAIIHGKANQLRRMAEAGNLQLPDVTDCSRKIEDTAMRISRIVGGLRAFAREGDEDPFQVVKVVKIVDETLELCRAKFLHHDIDLRSSIPLELEVPCRPVQISQVLLSLLSNAHDAILPLTDKWISIGAHPLDMWIDITVTDSGHGIPSEIREKVMQPFFTTKEVGRGVGLGLSSARGIAESHHGALFVDPDSTHTRLVLRLPRAQAKPQAA